MTLRIYISSTFRDLGDERALVAEYLVKTEHLPIQTVIASAGPVLEDCLADVASCDALILLVASSYGTIEADRHGIRRSVTHHEFVHARDLGKPILAFDLSYVHPPETISDEQRQGLRNLRSELTKMERIMAPVTSQSRLLGEVLAAVQKQIRKDLAGTLADTADGKGFSLHFPSLSSLPLAANSTASSLSKEMYVQVQLKPLADRFVLIPEVFLPGPGDGGWQPCPAADPHPCEGVILTDLVDTLAELCEQAQRALPREPAEWIEKAVIELLLPDEVLAELLLDDRGEESPAAGDLCKVLTALADPSFDYPFLLRSLQRAERCKRAPIQANTIRTHWRNSQNPEAGLLVCTRWPAMNESSIRSFESDLKDPKRAVSAEDPKREVSALVALLPCPTDREDAGTLLKAILRSPLPVVLLWRHDGADPASRWTQASALLERQLPADLPAVLKNEAADSHQLHSVPLPPRAWCSLAAAERRKTLLAKSQLWVHQALLLVDCPQRWPGRITAARPGTSGRYQLRRATTP